MSSEKPVVVVFGATRRRGSAVARALVMSGEFSVRGVTWDLQSRTAQLLQAAGVELMNYDLNDRMGPQRILQGAYACFVNPATNVYDSRDMNMEIDQGRLIADCCKLEQVPLVVFSYQFDPQRVCCFMAQVVKEDIENYMRQLNLPLTCLITLPKLYHEELLNIFSVVTTNARYYDIENPLSTTLLDMIRVGGVGKVVVSILREPPGFVGNTVSICGDKLYMGDMAQMLSTPLRPMSFMDERPRPPRLMCIREMGPRFFEDWGL